MNKPEGVGKTKCPNSVMSSSYKFSVCRMSSSSLELWNDKQARLLVSFYRVHETMWWSLIILTVQSCFVCSTLVGGRICAKLPRSLCRKSLFSPTKRKVHSQLTLFLYRFSVTPSVRTVLRNSVECNSDSYLQFYVLSSSYTRRNV